MPTVYRKTHQGRREIETRALGLGPRLRRALILADGRRDDAELARLLGSDAGELLAQLLAQGYVDVLAETPAPHQPAAPQDPAAVLPAPAGRGAEVVTGPAQPGETIDARKRAAAAHLTRLLGANARMSMSASVAARRIEQAATEATLDQAMQQAERLIALGVGPDAAREFHRGYQRAAER
jgi:hypothetical protein